MQRLSGNVLLVGRVPAALATMLSTFGLEVAPVVDGRAALAHLEATLHDVVLVGGAEGRNSSDELSELLAACPDTPVVAVGTDDPGAIREALGAGAAEYLVWPSSAPEVNHLMEVALVRGRTALERESAQAMDAGLLGGSRQLAAVKEVLARAAPGSSTVLVRGETGTGKELAARAIHRQSPRVRAAFVKVHTPAVPDALLESELFGYERGAFTGATTRKPGRVELAEGGTLFLDEIGEISPTMQAKLLRLIQDREYERLGGTRTLRADIRVVAATHRDLEHLVDSGAFREDLFYRLNVVTLWLPPLRARREDIPVIVHHYLGQFCRQNRKQLRLDEAAIAALVAERWPGNVRQLVNTIEKLVVLAAGPVIDVDSVRRAMEEQATFLTQAAPLVASFPGASPTVLEVASFAPPPPAHSALHFSSAVRPLREDVRRTELRAITKALHAAKGNRALAARLLGVSRRTLYTKLEELGLD